MTLGNGVPDVGRLKADLARLVAFDTQNPPGQEAEIAGWVSDAMAGMGCSVRIAEVMPARSNVIGVIENGPGPVFAFNTHLDVVAAGDGWTGDAFRLREDGGRLYGRGACDAKGSLACMLEAMRALAARRGEWSGTVLGVFVCDEEASSRGARAYAIGAPKIDYCIIGEPTSCTTVIAHKGSLRPLVRIHGRTAHSGTPDLGLNAILKAEPLLRLVGDEHLRIRGRSHPLVGSPSMTVTRIVGGHADNVIPQQCDLLIDRRMIPGEDEAVVTSEIDDLLARAADASGARHEVLAYRPTTGGATATPKEHPIVRAAQRACRDHHRRETPVGGFQGGCDLVHFASIGAAGLVLGPGSLEVAHQPDEFVPIDDLLLATRIYRDIALQMLTR